VRCPGDYFGPGGFTYGAIANNVYYDSFPWFDPYGINVRSSGPLNSAYEATNASSVRYFNDAEYWGLMEEIFVVGQDSLGPCNGACLFDGLGQFAQSSSVSDIAAFNSLCNVNAGPLQTFSFCYYMDGTSQSPPFFSYAYGVFSANGPVTRFGRAAYSLANMTGIRTIVLDTSSAAPTTVTNNILYLKFTVDEVFYNGISHGGVATADNFVYVDWPYVDAYGLVYKLDDDATFVSGVAKDITDVSVFTNYSVLGSDSLSLGEYAVAFVPNYDVVGGGGNFPGATNPLWAFDYALFWKQPDATALCQSTSPFFQPKQVRAFSLCYMATGGENGGWAVTSNSVIHVYTVQIIAEGNNRAGYPLLNVTGLAAMPMGWATTA
jgi:hypothetical protein